MDSIFFRVKEEGKESFCYDDKSYDENYSILYFVSR